MELRNLGISYSHYRNINILGTKDYQEKYLFTYNSKINTLHTFIKLFLQLYHFNTLILTLMTKNYLYYNRATNLINGIRNFRTLFLVRLLSF